MRRALASERDLVVVGRNAGMFLAVVVVPKLLDAT